jgi:carbamoyl-phosphate synthase small subunit
MSLGFLVLETGEAYRGQFCGGESSAGEVVFNTSHTGYEEIATDPSYFGQIIVMTAPMQGNYSTDRAFWESRKMWIDGFISVEIQNSERDSAWRRQLAESGIPILVGLDTREIVMRLRQGGDSWGAVVNAKDEASARALARDLILKKKRGESDWVHAVSRKSVELRPGQSSSGPRVAVMDFGAKENIIRELCSRASEVAIFPSRTSADEIRAWNPDGIMLSNGPGDPSAVIGASDTVRSLLGWKPIFGICMGHQILSLALGAKTYKLPFGHRGSNHPVRDHLLNMVYVTSQNHGYAVDGDSLPTDVRITHINLNDGSVEGIECPAKLCFSVQYHPESHPGPHEAVRLFDYFIERIQR